MSGAASLFKKSISSIVTLLIGVFVLLSIPDQIAVSEGEGVNARTVPYLIAGLIIVLSLLIIVSDAVKSWEKQMDVSIDEPPEATSYFRVFLAFAAIAVWIVILPYLGFNIAKIFLVTSIMLIVGNCRWWQIALLSLALSVPINYLLGLVLRVYLPSGSIFD